jgi:hypothetical protein
MTRIAETLMIARFRALAVQPHVFGAPPCGVEA